LTPRFSSFSTTACSRSGRISLLMLGFLFRVLAVALGFFSGAGSGGLLSAGLRSEKLLESAGRNLTSSTEHYSKSGSGYITTIERQQ